MGSGARTRHWNGLGRGGRHDRREGRGQTEQAMRWIAGALPAFVAMAVVLFPAIALSGDLDRALSLAGENRNPEARKALAPVLERDPRDPQARLLHGVLLAREERVDEAIDVFEALRLEHPAMPEPYNNLAVLHATQGRLEHARAALLAAIERQPDFAAAYANLSGVYARLADRALRRAAELGAGAPAPGEDAPAARTRRGGEETSPDLSLPQAPADPPARPPPAVAAAAAPERPESPPAPARPAARPPVTVAASGGAPAVFCAHAEGFRNAAAAAAAEQWLQASGMEVEVRPTVREVMRTLVYLPPLASPEEAAAKMREVRARGVRDVGVIREGPLANGISFGLYTVEANASRRIDAVERLGYAAARAPNAKTVREYVVEARAGSSFVRDGLEASWAARFPGRPLLAADCG